MAKFWLSASFFSPVFKKMYLVFQVTQCTLVIPNIIKTVHNICMASININRYNSRYTGTNVLSVLTLNIKLQLLPLRIAQYGSLPTHSTFKMLEPCPLRAFKSLASYTYHYPCELTDFFNVCRLLHSESLPIRNPKLTFQNTIHFYIIISFQQRLLPKLQVKLKYFQTLHFRVCEKIINNSPNAVGELHLTLNIALCSQRNQTSAA